MKKILYPIYTFVFLLLLQGCLSDSDDTPSEPAPQPVVFNTIFDVASANSDFSTLVAALQATGLDQVLDDPNQTFTVFAPTDAAFDVLGQDTIDALLADTDTLTSILQYHVISGAAIDDFVRAIAGSGSKVVTVNGKEIAISLVNGSILINGATVTTRDIITDNGVIHVIDAVLTPPDDPGSPTLNIVETLIADDDFNTLVSTLEVTNLDIALADPDGNFTVFAPTDAAFDMLGQDVIDILLSNTEVLSSILLQHVLDSPVDSITAFSLNGQLAETLSGARIPIGINQTDDTPTYGGANVVIRDIYTSNGIIHAIDMVVVGDVSIEPPPVSVYQRAVEADNFTTLVAALDATGLDAALDDLDTNYTVFAPTDDAFALLGTDTINALLADPDGLSDILLYHVISGSTILADDALSLAGTRQTSANGDDFAISFSNDTLFINGVSVTATNILASNGVIHVLDAVLIPPADPVIPATNIVETAIAAGNFSTLVSAIQAAGLDDFLADPDNISTVFAPTDAAFQLLGQDNINALLSDPDTLTQLLLQHVVAGSVDSISAFTLNGTSAPTRAGNEIPVGINAILDVPTYGGANVTTTDIYTSNGIIHVIDIVVVGDIELPGPTGTGIVQTLIEQENFTTLVTALQTTGLDDVLDDLSSTYTVFAPNDAAFDLLGADTIEALLADPDGLSDILLYHVLPDATILADEAISLAGTKQTTVNGKDFAISLTGNVLFINGVSVISTNILADNGVIHVLDAVLTPPVDRGNPTANIVDTAIADGNFTTLVAALQAAGLDSTLADPDGDFTVFAPTDAAFALLGQDSIDALLLDIPVLTELLTQHVVAAQVDSITAFSLNGTNATTVSTNEIPIAINAILDVPTFGGVNVTTTDIYTTNGIIHVVDAVVVGDVQIPGQPQGVMKALIDAGIFNNLAAALRLTELDQDFEDLSRSFTLFAPTDAAFAALGDATLNALIADPDTFRDILLYHALSGSSTIDVLAPGTAGFTGAQYPSLNGRNVSVSAPFSTVFINAATVTSTDLLAENGVIQTIDAVLTPPPAVPVTPTQNMLEILSADSNFSTLVSLIQFANVESLFTDPSPVYTFFAPTNDVFANLDPAVSTELFTVQSFAALTIRNNLFDGRRDSYLLYTDNGNFRQTEGGLFVEFGINAATDKITYENTDLIETDRQATNGIIHVSNFLVNNF